MDIREPEITREQVLVLKDENFTVGNVCIVTAPEPGSGGPPPSRPPLTTS